MTGEIQNVYATKESDTGSEEQGKSVLLPQFSEKRRKESPEPYKSEGLALLASTGTKFVAKEKEYSQREAIIRPQQTGKIDFKSLQNRPKFSSDDSTWPSSKGCPQSPTGKKTRDKGKKSGKSERSNPHQSYRLSITNSRSNPTIGIAYPQQKITPPKKLEAIRGPISGSYRFHVPSIPEREAELQQQELSYSRCFQEAPSSFISTNYTSQPANTTGSTAVQHHPANTQQLGLLQSSTSSSNTQPGAPLQLQEFQVNGTSSWQSPEKTFNGATYGGSSHKLSIFTEGNKSSSSFVPLTFQYEYPSLQESATDPFPCDQSTHPEDYINMTATHISQSPFVHSSGEGHEDSKSNCQPDPDQPEGRTSFNQTLQHSPFLHSPHGPQSSLHCYKGRNEHTSDNETLISSSNQLEQSNSGVSDSPTTFRDNTGVVPVSVSKKCSPKDSSQRILVEGNGQPARNSCQGLDSQMHLTNKAYNSSLVNAMQMGTAPFEKSIPCGTNKNLSKLPQTWEGNNVSSSLDHSSLSLHSISNDKNQFNCQSAVEQKLHGVKNRRMPWQQIHLTSVMPKQNRIELSRQLSNQKLTFLATVSDWQDTSEPHRNVPPLNSPDTFHSKTSNESFTSQQEGIKQNCSTTSVFPFDSGAEVTNSQVCDTRSEPLYFERKESCRTTTRTNSHAHLQVSPVGLSPSVSPLSSSLQNATSTSTCSSLSPTSSSPVISSEDTQLPTPGAPPPFYHHHHHHHHQGKILTPSDHLNSDFHHFHTNLSRTFLNPPERVKENSFSNLHNIKYRSGMDSLKNCMHIIPTEHKPPPSYSSHQLLASSLATANLDQLDVLLTCKQCDQNFHNLASFLDHKQYCGSHMLTHKNELKNEPKMEESRKCQNDTAKTPGSTLSKYPSDPHLSLLGLNKNGELISDSEIKGEPKDDTSKLSLFAVTSNLPLPLPDLEMDDAKLDSLITEALNGLGYQSDNAEIDSSFIDAFADDEITTAKVTGSMQMVKTKDCMMYDNRSKHVDADDDRCQSKAKCLHEFDKDSLRTIHKNKTSILEKVQQEQDISPELEEKTNFVEGSPQCKLKGASPEEATEQLDIKKEGRHSVDNSGEANKKDARFFLSSSFTERSTVKTFQQSYSSVRPAIPQTPGTVRNSGKTGLKDSKRKKAGGGTWSKELIHKIVQQKNKLHKLHAKATKNQQFSLVMGKLTPVPQDPKFEEYDYVSDSDEDCRPLKMVTRGHLGHSRRYKYTYSKEYKGRERHSKSKLAPWKCESNESLEVKVTENISPATAKQISGCRMRRRRSSRSSTSSEQGTPTSISCESMYSPKNTDRTDSDSEKGLAVKKISSSNVLLMDYYVHDVYETSTVETCKEPNKKSSQLFSRNTKRYGSAKFLLSANLNSCRIGMESKSELSNSTNVSKSTTRYNNTGVPSLGREQHCSPDVTGMVQSTEQCSNLLEDRPFNDAFEELICDSTTSGHHSKLLAREVISDTGKASRTQKGEICDVGKSESKRSGGTFSNSSTDFLSNTETQTILNKEQRDGFKCMGNQNKILNTPSLESVHKHPPEVQDLILHKEITRPDPAEPDQSLIKSPLPFDTSSLFGELTVAGFDSGLYTDIPVNSEGFNTFGTRTEKKELFDPTFSSYLRNKDWSLMTDATSVLRDEGPQFKDISEKAIMKKANVQLTLPDKILDYDTNPTGTVSEDELEIKKIVSELESKLQTDKQNSSFLNANDVSKHLTINKSSSLHLDHESGNDQSGAAAQKSLEYARMVITGTAGDANLAHPYIDTDPSWSSPFHFGLLEGQHCVHTQVQNQRASKDTCVPEHHKFTPVTTRGDVQSPLKQIAEDADMLSKSFTEKPEELIDSEMYTENLMKCLEVISDTVLKKPCLAAELEESNLSEFLNPAQPCKNDIEAREYDREMQFSQTSDADNRKPQQHGAVLFEYENSKRSLDGKCELSSNQRDSAAAVLELEPKECKDTLFQQNLSDDKKSQITINRSDSEPNKFHFIEEKIEKDETSMTLAPEKLQSWEEHGQILGSKESVSEQQHSGANKHDEREYIKDAHDTVLLISNSLPVSAPSENRRDDPKDSNYVEESPETSNNTDDALISPAREGLPLGSAGHDIAAYHLLEPDPKDKITGTTVHKNAQKVPPSNAEDAVLSVCQLMVPGVKDIDGENLLLTVEDHNSTQVTIQQKNSAFENNSKVMSEFCDTSKQDPSDLMTSPPHAECRDNTISTEESSMSHINAVPGFSPQSPLLLPAADSEELHKCSAQGLWNNLGTLSQAGRNLEINTKEIKLVTSSVLPNSGMPDLLIVDLGMAEHKNSDADCEVSISSNLSLLSTFEDRDCFVNSRQTLKADESKEHKQEPLYKKKQTPLDFKNMSELSHREESDDTSTATNESTKGQDVLIPDQWQLSSVKTMQMGKNSAELPVASAAELCSSNPALQTSSTQSKSTPCSAPSCPPGRESATSPVVDAVLELSSKVPNDADLCQSHLETIDYMDLDGSLSKKRAIQSFGVNMPFSESDHSSLKQFASDDQESFQAKSMCPEEASGISSKIRSFKLKGGACKTIEGEAKTFSNDNEKDNVVSKMTDKNGKNVKQGTILCDICCACFRTLPGLKRHKAVKHTTKKDGDTGSENVTTVCQEGVPVCKKTLFLQTGPGDDVAAMDYQDVLQNKRKENRNKASSEVKAVFYRISKEEVKLSCEGTAESNAISLRILEGKEKQRALTCMSTFSNGCEVQKNRKSDNAKSLRNAINPDQFSDDLLNMLKTDILQAITPNFLTTAQESHGKQLENQDKHELTAEHLKFEVNEEMDKTLANSSLHGGCAVIHENEVLSCEEKSTEYLRIVGSGERENNEIGSNTGIPGGNFHNTKEACDPKVMYVEKTVSTEAFEDGPLDIKCEKNSCLTEFEDSNSFCFKDPSPSLLQPTLGLEALLDDDSTFSQLFPRDEAIIRKKCARVYSKRSKKQQINSILPVAEISPASRASLDNEHYSETHSNSQTMLRVGDNCKYDTISMDHAIMLDMCHKSTLKNDFDKMVYKPDNLEDPRCNVLEDNEDLGIQCFPSPTNLTKSKTTIDWGSSIVLTENALSSNTQNPLKSENPICPQQFLDPAGPISGELQEVSHFRNIDIQELNTKFQLPEMPLFDASKNLPLDVQMTNEDMDVIDGTKSTKKPTERRGRKRVEGGLKLRDKQYKCKVCFTWFLTLGELNFHKLSHNPSPPPTCYMCVQRKFSSREQLRDHLREKHAKNKAGIWTCGMCLKEISDVWMYNEHLREHATQFARKGQTQSSILGLPGSFMQETAVKNFITSIMQHRSTKASKGEKAKMLSKEAGKAIKENVEEKAKTKEVDDATEEKTNMQSEDDGKQTAPSQAKALYKGEVAQRNSEMHPNCKDPSRDCHHCGKQFPKPFKLQRHLVVHSLQKIFLCHKCPIFYQDAKELKDHLKNVHEEMEEQDPKHTALYTCELCADVMHVIKKSFICSSCNYTFSKKEQFDRHMEKHLTEGSQIFKFRGVLRPSKPSSCYSKDVEFDFSPSKRRKTVEGSHLDCSSDSNFENISALQFNESADTEVPNPGLTPASNFAAIRSSSERKDNGVKNEVHTDDFPKILSSFQGSQIFVISDYRNFSSSAEKTQASAFRCSSGQTSTVETCNIGEECGKPPSEISNVDIKDVSCNQTQTEVLGLKDETQKFTVCNPTGEDSESSTKAKQPLSKDSALTNKTLDFYSNLTFTRVICTSDGTSSATDSPKTKSCNPVVSSTSSLETVKVCNSSTPEKMSQAGCTKDVFADMCTNLTSEASDVGKEVDSHSCREEKQTSADCVTHQTEVSNMKHHSGCIQKSESQLKERKTPSNTEQGDSLDKDKVLLKISERTKRDCDNSLKPGLDPVTHITQKKRKELKEYHNSKVSASATRENVDVEMRNTKKLRVHSCSKSDGAGGYRKADATIDYPVLSSVRDDLATNKIVPKHKTRDLKSQTKKNPFNSCLLKKAENVRKLSRDPKGKKGLTARHFQLPASKQSISCVNSSLNMCRPLSGMRPLESHSYRTAESQNHLLSQLFGQKLTSFKIPLRKDTSESLN